MDMMKILRHSAVAVTVAVTVAVAATGCTGGGAASKNCATDVEPLVVDSVACADSLAVGGCVARCTVSVDFPESGDSALINNLRRWISGRLVPYNGMTPENEADKHGVDTITDGNRLVLAACKASLEVAEGDFVQFEDDGITTTYEYDYSVRKAYETPAFVTYVSHNYVYSGGAHGGVNFSGAVFALADGRQYGWNNMFEPEALDAVRGLIAAGLMADYFKVDTQEAFMSVLQLDPGATELPLPVASPVFMAEGVEFVYQQYEIACYAAGIPTCTIPYDKLMDKFTPQVRGMLAESGI